MIRMVRYVCPGRHTILGLAYNTETHSPTKALEMLQAAVKGFGLNPHCGMCGSTALKYEDAQTTFKTIEEARPHLMLVQANDVATRIIFDATRQSFDSQHGNN